VSPTSDSHTLSSQEHSEFAAALFTFFFHGRRSPSSSCDSSSWSLPRAIPLAVHDVLPPRFPPALLVSYFFWGAPLISSFSRVARLVVRSFPVRCSMEV